MDQFPTVPESQFVDRRKKYRRTEDIEMRQRALQLDTAQRMCQAFFQHHEVDVLVELVLHKALELVDAEAGSVLLADHETEQLIFRYVIGEKADFLRGQSFPWEQGIAGAVFKSGEPEVIPNVKHDPRHFGAIDQMTGYKTHNMITMPLKKWEGSPIGVLNILNKRSGYPTEHDLALLTILSTVASVAIQQARHFEEAKLAEVVRLLGDLGHDLKNLLQPIVTGTELLKGEVEEIVFRLGQTIDRQALESLQMCDQVIDMVQSTSRRIQERMKQMADCIKGLSSPPNFVPCFLGPLVESVFKTLSFVAEERRVFLQAEGLNRLPQIIADERRLFNAFYNLVNNAIPEVPPEGSIIIRGDSEPGSVKVTVADTGRGMPLHVLESLFSPRTVSRKTGGTGLGTKIVKDVIDAHRGNITVESEEGRGTVFTIRLPIDPLSIS